MKKLDYEYDVFVSHAVEDKIPIANELYKQLERKKLKVWYSGTELSVGDRLTDSIHRNLDKCRFGVVIISPTYLSKIWALNEFFFLLTREKVGQKVILPVLYDITPEELAFRSPLMADIFAVRASKGIDYVTEVLYREIQKQSEMPQPVTAETARLRLSKQSVAIMFALFLLATVGLQLVVHHLTTTSQVGTIGPEMKNQIDLQSASDLNLQPVNLIDYDQPVQAANIQLNLFPQMEGTWRMDERSQRPPNGVNPERTVQTTLVFGSSTRGTTSLVITLTVQYPNVVKAIKDKQGTTYVDAAKTTRWEQVNKHQ